MGISIKEIVTGRKTFFITPDTSLLPESFLEDYFALGYECYFIENDKKVSLEKKLDILVQTFHDVIFFFNVDYNIADIEWPSFIRNIIDKYHNYENVGVIYAKRQNKTERERLENKYLFEMGLGCGCIQLEYQRKNNFTIIEKILSANQAQGRRKNIRALCTKACTFSTTFDGNPINGVLQDISLSHFSLLLPPSKLKLELYEKLPDIHFNIRGFLFRSDAVLIMERPSGYEQLYVFGFVSSEGTNGLDARIKALLIPNIYQLLNANCKNLLNQIYNSDLTNFNAESSEIEDTDNGN